MAKMSQYIDKLKAMPNPELPQTALVYGAPKTGKTALVAQLARKYNVLWLDVEKGAQTLFTALPQEFWPKIELIDVADTQDSPVGIRMLNRLYKNRAIVKFCDRHGDINCPLCAKLPPQYELNYANLNTSWVIVIDSLSRVSDSAMAHALGQQGDMIFKKKEFTHYDNQGLLLKSILVLAKQMPCHSVFISHEEELDHEDGTSKITPVAGTRNFSRRVAQYFDHVIYTSIRMKKYCISSLGTSDMKVQSGTRSDIDIKSADDFINIFSAKPLLEGVTKNFNFSHEATELAKVPNQSGDPAGTTSTEERPNPFKR